MWTYKLLPGGGLVAFQTEQPFPRLWLLKLHSVPCSFPRPRTLYTTVGERLYISRVPEGSTNTMSGLCFLNKNKLHTERLFRF